MSEVVAHLEDALKDLRAFRDTGCATYVTLAREELESALRVYLAEQAMSEDEARL